MTLTLGQECGSAGHHAIARTWLSALHYHVVTFLSERRHLASRRSPHPDSPHPVGPCTSRCSHRNSQRSIYAKKSTLRHQHPPSSAAGGRWSLQGRALANSDGPGCTPDAHTTNLSIPVLSVGRNVRCLPPASARMANGAAAVGGALCGVQTTTALSAHANSVLAPRLQQLGCVLIIHMSDRSPVCVALLVPM